MKRNKILGLQQQERRRPENEHYFSYIHNEGTIIVNTNCKRHVVLLTKNLMEQANKYIKQNTYIHTHTYIHKCTHTYIHTYTHKYKHTYIHTYTHTYTHTYIDTRRLFFF